MRGIFISYRRSDSEGHAGRLFEDLRRKYGNDLVFLDVENIPPGVDFRKTIAEKVALCDVLLVLIGKSWLFATDENGKRRLDDEDDFVRIEIATALSRNIPVIPVLVQGVGMPSINELPVQLRDLHWRNAFPIRHDRWGVDVKLLIKKVDAILTLENSTDSVSLSENSSHLGTFSFAGVFCATTIVILLVYTLLVSLKTIPYEYLLLLFPIISAPAGFWHKRRFKNNIWHEIPVGILVAVISILAINLENYWLYRQQFMPQSTDEWRITAQFFATIWFGFFAGTLIASLVTLIRAKPSLN